MGTGWTGTHDPGTTERRSPMTTIKLTSRYARYLLTSLATVAFGLSMN
jgi:hypothetical protein